MPNKESNKDLGDPVTIKVEYGWTAMTPIQRTLPNGDVEMGHRITRYDGEGSIVETKEVYNAIISYD